MAFVAMIGGVEKTQFVARSPNLTYEGPYGERKTARFSLKPGYKPALHDTVILIDDLVPFHGGFAPSGFAHVLVGDDPSYNGGFAMGTSTTVFSGMVYSRSVVPSEGNLFASVECVDWSIYGDWDFITLSYTTVQTLKTVLTALWAGNAFGVTVDAAQATGPTLEPFAWDTVKYSDAMRELSTKTGYVVSYSAAKVVRMTHPSAAPAAPFSITDGAPNCLSCSWSESDENYATRVGVICGPDGATFKVILESVPPVTPRVTYAARAEKALTVAAGTEIATGILAMLNRRVKQIIVVTREPGLAGGQVLTINLTSSDIIATALITRVAAELVEGQWLYTAEALEGAQYQNNYLDLFRAMLGGSGGIAISGGGGGGVSPMRMTPFPLGGSDDVSLSPAKLTWTKVVTALPYVAPMTLNCFVRVSLWARTALVAVTARLYDLTAVAVVAESSAITETSPTETLIPNCGLTINHRYELQISWDSVSVSDGSMFGFGQLESY